MKTALNGMLVVTAMASQLPALVEAQVALLPKSTSSNFGFSQHAVHQSPGDWSIATTYPADTVSGRAASDFAHRLNSALSTDVHVVTRFEDKAAPGALIDDSNDKLFGILFAGDLASKEAILALSLRPYSVSSIAQARDLAVVTKPAYRTALAHQGLVLLAVIPWPPTGMWSRRAITLPQDLVGLRIRTYDESSRRVMEVLGAKAVSLPIQEALAQIKAGNIDAVLSSGDGDAGRAYAEVLPNFTALRYAYPVSFLVTSKRVIDSLPESQRSAVFQAGVDAERFAWKRLPSRIQLNYKAMSARGVTVRDPAPSSLINAVVRAAKTTCVLAPEKQIPC